jgi:hypothetical protein
MKLPEKKIVCFDLWHGMNAGTSKTFPRSCPTCHGIESSCGVENNITANMIIDLCQSEVDKAVKELTDVGAIKKFLTQSAFHDLTYLSDTHAAELAQAIAAYNKKVMEG